MDITDFCNLRCKTCYNPHYSCSGDLDFEKIKIILEFFQKKGYNRLQLLGGEPLMYRELGKLISFAKELGYEVSLVTNGILLGEAKIIDALSQVDLIYISFDGTSVREHDYVRGVGSYNKTLQALLKFREANDDVALAALFVLNARRSGQPIFKWVEEIGFDGLSLQVIEPSGVALNHPELLGKNDILWGLLAQEFNTKPSARLPYLLKAPPLFKNFLREKGVNIEINKQDCYGFIRQIYVDIRGNIFPCRLAKRLGTGFSVKNLNNFPYNNLSAKFFKSEKNLQLPDICQDCKFKKVCKPCHLQVLLDKNPRQLEACRWTKKQIKKGGD